MTPPVLRVTVADKKYTVLQEADGRVHALRYGIEWRELSGDGLVLALAQEIETLRAQRDRAEERLEWLHRGSDKDAEGYEWGVYRVKWDAQGQPVSVLHTLSDLSADLDEEILRASCVLP